MAVNYIRRKYALKKYALEHDLEIPVGFRVEADGFGKPAIELLKRVQRHAGIRVTGTWTAATQELLFPTPMRVKALNFAKGDLGLNESPPNSNRIKYTEWWGWGPCAYCVIACSYWYKKAGSRAIVKGSRWANTDNLLHDARLRRNGVRLVTDPKPGDIFVIDFDGHIDPDHAGLVEKVIDSRTVQTIEGNTMAGAGGNQAEGGGVYRRKRPRYNCWFIRVER